MVFERRILAKNNNGRQTRSEVKPGWVGLVHVLGWVITFKQKASCCADLTIFFILHVS